MPKPKKVFDHELHEIEVAPEQVVENGVYSFNYNPITQPNMDAVGGFTRWLAGMRRVFNSCHEVEIWALPEVSPKGRAHFHGTIKFIGSTLNFYLIDIHKLMGFGSLKIATIADIDVWENYCYKQTALMRPFCEDVHGIEYAYTSRKGVLGPRYIDGIIE